MTNRPIDQYGFRRQVPAGDNRERDVCGDCGWIHYDNPKIVVGAVCTWEDRYLVCLRAIEPRRGYWTIPAGYLEEHETTQAGAAREAWEEARAELEIDALLGVYNIPRISQVQIIYRARLRSPEVAAGEESQAVKLVPWADLPWDELAFPSVHWALKHHRDAAGGTTFQPFGNPDGERGDFMPRPTP